MRRSHVDIDVRELGREDRKSDLWTCAKATSSGDTSWRRGIDQEERVTWHREHAGYHASETPTDDD